MDAAAYNTTHASDPWRVQISWGIASWSSGSYNPSDVSTPASSPSLQTTSAPTASSTPASSPSTSGIISKPSNSWASTPGSSPVWNKNEKVKSFTNPVGTDISTTQNPWVTSNPQPILPTATKKTLLQIRDEIKAANPTMKPIEIMQEARNQFNQQQSVYNNWNALPEIPKTWIWILDDAQQKLRDETLKNIKDTYKNYALAQADYQKNAGYYTNFDSTNQKFNSVLWDIQNTLTNSNSGTLTDQQAAIIAAKNGVSVDAVKNPLNIYNDLQMTDEGKQVLGVTARENQIKDMVTANNRAKQDAKDNLDRNTQQLNYQIQDAQKQLQRNLDWATASGAWNGAARSSGYEQGMKNMADDTATIVNRINEQIWYLNADNSKYLNRLGEDFSTNMTRAKDSLDLDLKNMKFDSWLKLNGLSEKYGAWSKDLLKALDAIQEEFGTKSLDAFNKYLTSVKSIQGITMDNINLMDKMNTVTQALKNKRYNELTANNWALLQNMSLAEIAKEVQAGHMDYQKYADTRNLMISTVTNALQKNGMNVSTEALNTITHLIDNGATPAQAYSRISGWNMQTPSINAGTIADYSQQKRGRANLQCGELANDYWEQATWSAISHDSSFNTYQGKVSAVKKLGQSPIPQVGGIVVMNTWTSAGHIGIVQDVRADGSMVVLDANYEGNKNGGAPMLHVYQQKDGMVFSRAPTDMNAEWPQTVTRGTSQNRPDRNSNPWDLKAYWNDWMNIPWATGIDDENHIIFSNPTDGYNAMVKDLTAKMTWNSKFVSKLTWEPLWPNSTLADIWSVYAQDSGWAESVAKISWYTTDTKASDMDVNKLAPAIARQEWFTGTISAWASSGKKEYSVEEKAIMDDYLKNPSDDKNKATMRAHNLGTNDITAYTNMKNSASAQLSPEEESLVSGLKSYNLDPSKLPGGMSKEWQASKKRILAAAFNDPNYDMKKYPARQTLYKNWTSGKMAENNNGITTVTRHMMELEPALKELENGNLKKFNQLWNSAETQFGVADTNNADTIANAIASEMAKVYKGGASPTEDEIKEWKSEISTSLSGWQQKGLINTLSHLLYGKVTSNAQNYARTMWEKPENIFDDESTTWLKNHGVDVSKDFTMAWQASGWKSENNSWNNAQNQNNGWATDKLRSYIQNLRK
jgi:hypothetical protein